MVAAFLLLLSSSNVLFSQATPAFPNAPITLDGRGVTVEGTDGVSSLTFRFRIQELFAATGSTEDGIDISETQLMIRRMRLRMEGVLRDPRLRVSFQLSFARSDMDMENTSIANVLRDANVSWQFNRNFAMSAGQGKLPGNRQRVVSSSEIQAPDRSSVNSLFTVDRDVGVFAVYSKDIGVPRLVARAAISSGEGRGASTGSDGLAYTGRFEVLPFGAFTNGGDYIEGDVVREERPRLSIGAAISHNDRAVREGGQLGRRLFEPRSMTTWFTDAIYKYQGFALQAEHARRFSSNPLTEEDGEVRYVFAGEGLLVQASYLFSGKHYEPFIRYVSITPALAVRGLDGSESLNEYAAGLGRYFQGHRIKINGDLSRIRAGMIGPNAASSNQWRARIGIEVGI